jgi:catechol 2,3-dioxygenase-like lactoylglutathione lyase family enzyme
MSQRVFPQLRVTDWARSKTFYCDGLGFTVDWEHRFAPELPVFAQLTLEGLSIFVSGHSGDCQVGGAAYFFVDDVNALHGDFMSRGVRTDAAPADTDYGVRELAVVDPDGNRLRFGTRISS